MLNQMRALSQNWIGRSVMALVLGFIIVSFAIWGIGDRFSNFNASELAKVGSTSISVDAYRSAYQAQLQQLEQSQKRGITNDEARGLGLDRQVLSRLLRDSILNQEAARLGLAVGDTEVGKTILADDMFKGADGKFDRQRFDAVMSNNGLTEARYEHDQRGALLRQGVSDAVISGLVVPKIMAANIHRFQSEIRDVEFFMLPQSAAGTIPPPTDAQLTSVYDDHPATFTAPEYRKLVVLSVIPANLVKPAAVTDAEVQKRYDEMKDARFIVPEKRTLEQLVFPDAKTADAAATKLTGGETFDALVKEQKKSPDDVSLGTVAKGEIADHTVADAAFALPSGGTSKPVTGQFGVVLVHVSEIYPMRQQPLMDVSAQLKDELAIVKARADATRLRDAIEDQRTAGKTLTDAAASVGLKTTIIDAIDAAGRDKAHKPVEGLVDGPALLKAAFATDIGSDTEMLQTDNGGDAWFEVAGIEAPHRQALTDIKPQITAAWHENEINRRLSTLADTLVGKIDGGQTLAAVAAANGKLQVMKGLNIGRAGAPNLAQPVAAEMFSVPVGKAGTTSDRGLGRLVYQVDAARVPPVNPKDDEFTKLMAQVQTGFEDDMLSQYLLQLQTEIGVHVNQQALQTALGTGDTGGS